MDSHVGHLDLICVMVLEIYVLGKRRINYMKPEWNEFHQKILEDRYLLKDESGNLLEHKIEDVWDRIAKFVGSNKEERKVFRDLLTDFKFIPGGRMLAGLGSGSTSTFFNCFVIPITTKTNKGNDSRDALMETLANLVEITSRGGGVGLNFSVLRPRGSYVSKVKGFSSGPVSWGQAYNGVIEQVIQGGTRRGALMYMLDVWHPSIEEFITVKKDLLKLKNANLSVGVSDDFMKCVKEDKDWSLVFPDITFKEYDLKWSDDINDWIKKGFPIKVYKKIKARKLWRLISESAHATGEPGLVFVDRYQRESNTRNIEKIIGVNPCGEQGLGPWGVCNLGSINLVPFVSKDKEINWRKLDATIKTAVRFLDNVIDLDNYINEEIKEKQLSIRRIGLGTMGLADVLILLGLKYGSKDSLSFISELYSFIRNVSYNASIDLSCEKGSAVSFNLEEFIDSPFIKKLPEKIKEKIKFRGIRNLSILTQAPTGATSLLSGVSSGIEPIFSFNYTRTDTLGTHKIKHWLVPKVKDEGQFISAHEISPEDHVKVQSEIQKYIDSSISKTINAPNSHKVEEVEKIYMLAYDLGCKGITYFRDGSRQGVLSVLKEKSSLIKKRPTLLTGRTSKIKTPLGNLYLTMNEKDGKPYEVFCQIGKAGSDVSAFTESIGRLISIALQSGVSTSEVINQLTGIGGSNSVGLGKNKVRSVPDAIASVLSEKPTFYLGELCPKCGTGIMVNEEGCSRCQNCGFSKCG